MFLWTWDLSRQRGGTEKQKGKEAAWRHPLKSLIKGSRLGRKGSEAGGTEGLVKLGLVQGLKV